MIIRTHRNAKGYSQEYMARILGITLRHYINIENFKVTPNFLTGIEIAKILDIDINELIKHYIDLKNQSNI